MLDTSPNINNIHANALGEISLPSFTAILPAKINTASKHAITDKINRIISSPFLSLVKNSFILFSYFII